MPTAAKAMENMTKHLTGAEAAARVEAEAATLPDRGGKLKLRKPPFVAHNRAANKYWNGILRSMEGLVLLDDLDSEMLAGYCAMLARRDQSIHLVNQLMAALGVEEALTPKPKRGKALDAMSDAEFESSVRLGPEGLGPDQILEAVSKLDALTGKLQTLEKTLLTYADKLGLTPSGRVRLAQRRAEAAGIDPDADLFGG